MTAETQKASPTDLRRFADSHRKALQRHRDALHAFQIRLNQTRIPGTLKDEFARICRSSDAVAAEAHSIAMGLTAIKQRGRSEE